MTVLTSVTDPQALTLTVTARFAAPPERVWTVFSDPRRLERWWGPPTWPATFVDHDFRPGGRARYYMTGPGGEKAHGWWRFVSIDEPSALEFEDGFSDDTGTPDPDMPTVHARVSLQRDDEGTLLTLVSRFPSAQALEQLVGMGMEEGMKQALGQVDAILTGTTD